MDSVRDSIQHCAICATLSEEGKSDWKSYLGCMTHAYNCTKHASTTYSPYYLMFGRHPRLPIDVEFGLPKSNSGDNSSKSRYVQKLRRRLNYAFQKARVGVGKPKRYPVVFIFQHDNFLVTDFLQIKTD